MAFVAYHAIESQIAFYAHILLAPVALALTPFQLWRSLRMRRPALHRWVGRTYGVMVLLAGAGGLVMAMGTHAGAGAAWGFGMLAVVWVGTTGWGILQARAGYIDAHRRWMLRSVALSFSAVTLRLYLLIPVATGIDQAMAYQVIAWACWVPNLIAVEWLMRRRAGAGALLSTN
ncbi:MAG: hypothetical protein COC12_11440 [Rhodobacteraceae bacterium]|nr:MAG: hypothetical protein COC12_11440 [Paracoccaceae bacterium]